MKYILLIALILIFAACTKQDFSKEQPIIYYDTAEPEAEDLEKFKDTISLTLLTFEK
jgi:hypothetical protein